MALSYIVDRMLAEFAAASMLLAKGSCWFPGDEGNGVGIVPDGIEFSVFAGIIEDILQLSYPRVFPYYRRCLDSGHKHFTWKGPLLQIVPRSDEMASLIPLTTRGELLDLPSHSIYTVDPEVTAPATIRPIGKRSDREDEAAHVDQQAKKQKL